MSSASAWTAGHGRLRTPPVRTTGPGTRAVERRRSAGQEVPAEPPPPAEYGDLPGTGGHRGRQCLTQADRPLAQRDAAPPRQRREQLEAHGGTEQEDEAQLSDVT